MIELRGKHFNEVNSFHVNCEKRFFKCFKMQMVIYLAPVSLSNKKVNFNTCPRLTFLKKNAIKSAYISISEPLAARAFGARNLPRLVPKSGYGPVRDRACVHT